MKNNNINNNNTNLSVALGELSGAPTGNGIPHELFGADDEGKHHKQSWISRVYIYIKYIDFQKPKFNSYIYISFNVKYTYIMYYHI